MVWRHASVHALAHAGHAMHRLVTLVFGFVAHLQAQFPCKKHGDVNDGAHFEWSMVKFVYTISTSNYLG